MANRSYTTRQDFREGWNILANRYARPGTIKEMVNVMLDPLAEGALRQAYGTSRWGYTGTIDQFTKAKASGRYPGVCLITRGAEADHGSADEIIIGMMAQNGGQVDAHFYIPSAPETTTRKMNFPFGTTFSTLIEAGDSYGIKWNDWCFVFGEETWTDAVSVTVSVNGGGTWSTISNGISWQGATVGGLFNHTLLFTHNTTGETQSVDFTVGIPLLSTPTVKTWQAYPLNYGQRLYTGSNLPYFDSHPIFARFGNPATWTDPQGRFTSGIIFAMVYAIPEVIARELFRPPPEKFYKIDAVFRVPASRY